MGWERGDFISVFDPVPSLTPPEKVHLEKSPCDACAHSHICTHIHVYTTVPQGSMHSRLSAERGWLVFAQLWGLLPVPNAILSSDLLFTNGRCEELRKL